MRIRYLLLPLVLAVGFTAGLLTSNRSDDTGVTEVPDVTLETLSPPVVPAATSDADAPAADGSFPIDSEPPTPTPVTVSAPAGGGLRLQDFTVIAERTVPAVVNISSVQVVQRPNSPFGNDPFFRYFFGDGADVFGTQRGLQNSLGSGVIVTPDGYILTNNHVVVGDSDQLTIGQLPDITVVLGDRELRATIIGTDPSTDLALLKIDATNLPTIPWGDSDALRVAEWVLAIGNPYQLNQSVSLGIISALGRTNVGISAYEDFIQTDAAINPGNSGGALVNADGELVGINTAIFSQSGGYQGIGFAVPSNLAREVVSDLIRYGRVQRGSIGYVQIAPVTPQLAAELGAPGVEGVVITQMRRDSSAFRAGIRAGDILTEINGRPVGDGTGLSRVIQDAEIGSSVTFLVLRGGSQAELDVPIE